MVVVFGSINLDLVARVPRLPAPGETITGTRFIAAPGGKGANQALSARECHADVAMFGAVGRDPFATAALVNLRAAGVRLSGVAKVEAPTGIALINVDDKGENAITVIPGANAHARAADVPAAYLVAGNTLLVQLEVPMGEVAALCSRAHAAGATVVLNAAPALPLAPDLLRDIDMLVVNEHEAAAYASAWHLPATPHEFMAAVTENFGPRVVVTLGALGATTWLDGSYVNLHPPRVDVVDTTGAGDAFAGALVAALDGGKTIATAVEWALIAGAGACNRAGAQRNYDASP